MSIQRERNFETREASFSCEVRFDEDLPHGPHVEGTHTGGFRASVPPAGATWGLIAQLVAKAHQAEHDQFWGNGEMRKREGGFTVAHHSTVTPVRVLHKGGPAPSDNPAKEGSCTVVVSVAEVEKAEQQVCCTML
jgi:hypothetical protein